MLQNIRGTQDFLDLTLFNTLINAAREHLATYGFNEISLPLIEPTELFRRSLGLHTDVVTKEMFTVIAGDGEEAICLRPEITASVMRTFFAHGIQDQPWRVFSYGPVFRHERPQKGRYRQFHQLTVEILGAESISYDAEFLALVDTFLKNKLGLNNYALALNFLGSLDDRIAYKQALMGYLNKQENLPKAIIERKETNLLRIFDLKDPSCKEALKDAPRLIDYLSPESTKEWETLTTTLDQLSIPYTIDPRLVRGLDYYNKTVFEFVSTQLGAQNAICGGGRYDTLSQTLGEKKPLPSIGVGFGIERLMLILQEEIDAKRSHLQMPQKPALIAILPLSPAQQNLALLCGQTLRNKGVCCDVFLDGNSVKSMMRRANKLGARYAILIGEDEQKSNMVTIRDMINSTEQKVPQNMLEKTVAGM